MIFRAFARPCLVTLAACLALAGGLGIADASVRQRTSLPTVESQLMCVLCREPLAEADSPEAFAERATAQTFIDQGDTEKQVIHLMIGQYGIAVLAKPPARGFNLLIYILPPALVALGIAMLLYTLPKWRRRAREAASTPYAAGQTLSEADDARLAQDLARFD